MITITLSNKAAKQLHDLLVEEWNLEDQYTYEFEVIARYLELLLKENQDV